MKPAANLGGSPRPRAKAGVPVAVEDPEAARDQVEGLLHLLRVEAHPKAVVVHRQSEVLEAVQQLAAADPHAGPLQDLPAGLVDGQQLLGGEDVDERGPHYR